MQTDMKESETKMGNRMEGSSSQQPRSTTGGIKAIVDEWRDCGEAGGSSGEAQKASSEVAAIVDEWRDCGDAEASS